MRRHGGYDVLCLADRRAERAREAAARAKVPNHELAEGVEQLSLRDRIQAVTCGTAPFAHHRVIRSALEAGKHVLTEKPFTMTLDEGEELAALARDRGLVLAAVHNFQFAPPRKRLRGWLDSGRRGEVPAGGSTPLSNAAFRLSTSFCELPAGRFFDGCPHLIY